MKTIYIIYYYMDNKLKAHCWEFQFLYKKKNKTKQNKTKQNKNKNKLFPL